MKPQYLLYIALALTATLSQGFQCASSKLTTARKAIQQQDYVKARQALDEALVANPADCEALMMLGDVQLRTSDVSGMVTTYKSARNCSGLKPEQHTLISVNLYNAWVAQYNSGISSYNTYAETREQTALDESRAALTNAFQIKPEFPEPLSLLGQAHEVAGDTTAALEAYRQWWDIERPGFEIIRSKNLYVGSTRGSIIKALGTPLTTKMDTTESGLMYKDRFDVGGRDLITFTIQKEGIDASLEGWTYNPPNTISEPEKWRVRFAALSPLKSLAFINYQRLTYGEALTWTSIVMAIKPSDQELVPLKTQLLQQLGKTDEAMVDLRKHIASEPSSVLYRLQLATMLSTTGSVEEAVKEFHEVIKLEPTNETALYNLGANYKNLAGNKQRTEIEKLEKNPNYRPDTAYLKDLRTSAEYFERLRKSSFKYRDDIIVLEQLGNVYEVRKESAKVRAIIMELEALEEKYKANKEYYRVMEGLYGRNKMIDKMKIAQEKGKRL